MNGKIILISISFDKMNHNNNERETISSQAANGLVWISAGLH